MSRIPQNDPEFLAFQRQVKAKKKSEALKKAAIVATTVVLLLALLVVGVFMIYRAGNTPAESENGKAPELNGNGSQGGENNTQGGHNGAQSGNNNNEGNTENGGESEGSSLEGSNAVGGSENIDGSQEPGERKTVVYIDAGHGFGNSVGTVDKGSGNGTPYLELTGKYESDLNLEIAMKLKEVLLEKGYEVVMIREGETSEHLDVNHRVQKINSVESDIFISIHANSFDNEDVCGARVYYSSMNDNAIKCMRYASAVANALNTTEGVSQRNVTVEDHPDIGVIKAVKVPTVLVETCFLTSPTDAALAASEAWIASMAEGLCRGIENYLSQTALA